MAKTKDEKQLLESLGAGDQIIKQFYPPLNDNELTHVEMLYTLLATMSGDFIIQHSDCLKYYQRTRVAAVALARLLAEINVTLEHQKQEHENQNQNQNQ